MFTTPILGWHRSRLSLLRRLTFLLLLLSVPAFANTTPRTQVRLPAGRDMVELEARQQRREGPLLIAEGDVEIRYQELRFRADYVEYNTATFQASARGNIRFDFRTQHLEADEGSYNVRSGRGSFRKVRGTIHIQRRPNPNVLLTPNPLYFEAEEVSRTGDRTYTILNAWLTVCEPGRPTWRFFASRTTLQVDRKIVLLNANFRLLSIPIFYLPYASAPAGRNVRQSGFLLPDIGNSTRKGLVLGDSFYWAPAEWMDLTIGAQLFSRRGWSQIAEFRARPWENMRISAEYYGVDDRGLRGLDGKRVPQGGHTVRFQLESQLPHGWRTVADLNRLSSLTFRLAFAESFGEAINSEVRSAAFATNNFRGLSLNFSYANYKNFLNADPETSVVLRSAPQAYIGSVDQAPWKRWPVYFGFHAFADGVHRSDPDIDSPAVVQRAEFAPRVTIPLRWGPWLGVTPTFLVRTTRYGSQVSTSSAGNPVVIGDPLHRTTAEVTVDLRPPSLARVWERPSARWKHTIEPQILYRFVDGVNRFGRFLRVDENDTLTDTNEMEYSITQRLFRRSGDAQAEELLSWRLVQKVYFDRTFGGALVPGHRNVFQALDSITPFAFADSRRHFSPIVSDLRLTPGGRYDAQLLINYDTQRSKVTAYGGLARMRPYREFFITLAQFSTQASTILQPRSNQIRALVGYGELNRRGWNGAFGLSYDFRRSFLQNQLAQFSYNGGCCGIAFEYRRLALGTVRTENQFRVAFIIANIGTFGNLRRQERIF